MPLIFKTLAFLSIFWMPLTAGAREIHRSMIPVEVKTSLNFKVSDSKLQALHDLGMQQLKGNLSEFAPGMTILVEGGGYNNAWLETQPMGGEMYALHDLQVALNNQVIFIRGQRDDGRLPGMVIAGSKVAENHWDKKGFPAAHEWKREHDIVADYEMFQGYCFPEPAWRMYFWVGKNKDYLRQLESALKGHDAYLWRTRDSNGDGILETWCEWDTGEDASTRFSRRGAHWNWPFDIPPGADDPRLPKPKEGCRLPFQSMDIMAYSYSGRQVLANIARELGTGEEEKWNKAAEDVRQTVIEKLWDPERHACFDRDKDGKVLPELVHNNLRCMWYGMFTQEMADAFIKHHLLNPEEFWSPVPLTSIALNEELFLSKPRNNWSGQPQGLTYQRAIHALERYGHYAEVILLGRKLLPVLMRNGQFSQQLHEVTGEPSLSNSDGYGPMILAMQEYVARMHGIHIDVEHGQVWWSGLEPEGGEFSYRVEWGDRRYLLELKDGLIRAEVNGQHRFTVHSGVRVVTDLEGTPQSIVGIDSEERFFQLANDPVKVALPPNAVLKHDENSNQWVVGSRTAFDYPYADKE